MPSKQTFLHLSCITQAVRRRSARGCKCGYMCRAEKAYYLFSKVIRDVWCSQLSSSSASCEILLGQPHLSVCVIHQAPPPPPTHYTCDLLFGNRFRCCILHILWPTASIFLFFVVELWLYCGHQRGSTLLPYFTSFTCSLCLCLSAPRTKALSVPQQQ